MADVIVEDNTIVVTLRGWDRVWALKQRIEIPLSTLKAASPEPDAVKGWWKGWRVPGTHLPGLLVAGTYYRRGGREFWAVHKGGSAVSMEFEGGPYRRVVVGVDNPDRVIKMLHEHLRSTFIEP